MANLEKWHESRDKAGTYIIKQGLTVSTSRNLRGLRDYARKPGQGVARIETRKTPGLPVTGELRITYADGAHGFAFFCSHCILIDWVRNRRKWCNVETIHHDGELGYLTKPGKIAGN
jgi:hypothetical protein